MSRKIKTSLVRSSGYAWDKEIRKTRDISINQDTKLIDCCALVGVAGKKNALHYYPESIVYNYTIIHLGKYPQVGGWVGLEIFVSGKELF